MARRRQAMSADVREQQMIALAVDLAEKQLMEGTASSQVISHFLKLGSSQNRLEKEKLRMESELLRAKRERLESEEDLKDLYSNAMAAMRVYSGQETEVYEED